MKRCNLIALLFVVGTSLHCSTCGPVEAPPGEEGDQCTTETDCKVGLHCTNGTCTAVTADAGQSDATASDRQGTDVSGRDVTGVDLRSGDRPHRDHYGQDWQPTDHRRPDHYGQDMRPPPHDAGIHDRPRPDWTGFDFNIFTDGGGITLDAGIHGYDGGYVPGVQCGSLTCTGQQHCCVPYGAPPSCAATCPGGTIGDLECDDTQDCGNSSECCGADLSTFCIGTGLCLGASSNNFLICTNGSNCSAPVPNCCSTNIFAGAGVDLGWCQASLCQ